MTGSKENSIMLKSCFQNDTVNKARLMITEVLADKCQILDGIDGKRAVVTL